MTIAYQPTPVLNPEDIPIKPTILFDIDGVLNAYMHGKKPNVYYWIDETDDVDDPYDIDMLTQCRFSKQSQKRGLPTYTKIQWSSELAQDLYNFYQNNNVQYLWLTSWNEDANEIARQCLWQNNKPLMSGYIPTYIHFSVNDSKRSQIIELRNIWLSKLRDGEIKTIPPIVHFDDFNVKDPREEAVVWPTKYGIWGNQPNSHMKLNQSPYLFIQTHPAFGITKKQWRRTQKFIQENI